MTVTTTDPRPDFRLMTLSHMTAFYHLQMPRWLFADARYTGLSLEAKVAYTFLLNRFQLSRRNGWVNGQGEVYVIYTRADMASEMQISYKKAIACFRELTEKRLIWEQRAGRGLPNRIFMAEVQLDEAAAYTYDCAPFSPAPGPAETAFLDPGSSGAEEDKTEAEPAKAAPADRSAPVRPVRPALHDMPETPFRSCQTGTSGPAEAAVPDLPERHTSNTEKSKKEKRDTEKEKISTDGQDGRARGARRADEEQIALSHLEAQCELHFFEPEEAGVFRDVIAWLYYCDGLRLDGCTYPQSYVRRELSRLDWDTLAAALDRLRENENEGMKRTLAYAAKTVFSTLLETDSDIVLDPVLNRCRANRRRAV